MLNMGHDLAARNFLIPCRVAYCGSGVGKGMSSKALKRGSIHGESGNGVNGVRRMEGLKAI